MATPGVPTLQYRPVGSLNTLEFWWSYPQDDGGTNNILYYTLQCSSAGVSTVMDPSSFYGIVSSLTNQKTYTFQLNATNDIGDGPNDTFNSVQPGNPPAGPTNVQVSTINMSTALVTWNYSTNANEANIEWFKVSMMPLIGSTIKYAVYPDQTSTIITNISTYTSYKFQVQAINPAGYDTVNAVTSSIIFAAPTAAPTAITGLSTTQVTNGTITIAWSGGASASSYMYTLNNISTIASTDNGIINQTATFTNLSSNTKYTIEVTAFNQLGQATTNILPSNLSTLQMWLDGADPLNTGKIPSTGTIITNWSDKSGNSYNATGVNNPTYTATGISFNGSNQYFTTNYTSQAASETIFVVYNLTSNTQAGLVDTNSSGGRAFQSLNGTNGPSLAKSAIAWTLYGSYAIATGITYIAECTYSSSGINIYVSGNTSASNTTNPSFSAGTTTIGAGYLSPIGWYLNGYISEVVIYNTVLSTSNRQIVEGYLAWKWNIQSRLPSNHPYYLSQPGGITVTTGGFTPKTVTTLQLWLDAKDPLNTGVSQSSGTVISTWYDKSGNSYNATASGSPAMNASNSIALNGSTQYYSVNYAGTHTTETAFVIVKFTNTTGEQDIISGNTNLTRQFVVYQNLLNMYSYASGGLVTSTTVPASATQVLLEYTLNASTNLSIYNTGNLLTSVSGFTPVTEASIKIGVNGFANGGYLNGTISEVLIYNSVLSSTDRQKVEGYLAWKWGIQTSLPTNHPYYNASP